MGRRRFGDEIPADFRLPGEPETKFCKPCQTEKPITEFHLCSGKRHVWCRPCKNERVRVRNKERADVLRERFYAWKAANPDQYKAQQHRRRARKNSGSTSAVTDRDWHRLCTRYANRCAYCRAKPTKLQQDHVVPLSRGGSHSIGNILPACGPCNTRKSAKFLVELGWRVS